MIIDCDAHIMPNDAFEDLPEEFRDNGPILEYSDEGLLADIHFPGGPGGGEALPANEWSGRNHASA